MCQFCDMLQKREDHSRIFEQEDISLAREKLEECKTLRAEELTRVYVKQRPREGRTWNALR